MHDGLDRDFEERGVEVHKAFERNSKEDPCIEKLWHGVAGVEEVGDGAHLVLDGQEAAMDVAKNQGCHLFFSLEDPFHFHLQRLQQVVRVVVEATHSAREDQRGSLHLGWQAPIAHEVDGEGRHVSDGEEDEQ